MHLRPRALMAMSYLKSFEHVSYRFGGTTLADLFEVDSYPRGYARMAAFLDCDANLSVIRKYL